MLSHNQNEAKKGTNRFVTVEGSATLGSSASSITRLSGSNYYTVTCEMSDGLINKITVN